MANLEGVRTLLERRGRELGVLLGLCGLGVVYIGTAAPVTVLLDGESLPLRTHARTVAAALHEAGIDLAPADFVAPERDERIAPGTTIRLIRAQPVIVEADGERAVARSPSRIPANILAESGVRLYPGDEVWADGVRLADPHSALSAIPSRLRVVRAFRFTVSDHEGSAHRIRSAAPTIGQALWQVGIGLYQGDRLHSSVSLPPREGLRLDLDRARMVTVLADGREFRARVGGETVGEVLTELGLVPVGLDYAIPDVAEPVPVDGVLRLVRVREEFQIELKPLPFKTVYEAIPDLEIDSRRLIEPGAYGVAIHRVRIRLEDGEEVTRTVEGEWTAVEPKPQRVGYGTQIVIRTLDTADGLIEYWRAVPMYATSYSPSRAGTSPDAPWYGITYSGQPLRKGLVAIDPRYIPMGTMMYVPGYGYARAADVGGGVRGRWIDLGYSDDDFVRWHHWVTVYFLTPPPPASSIVWIFP